MAKPVASYETQMKDDLDGTLYPPFPHYTEKEAREYAALRSSQKKCEIKVVSSSEGLIGTYRNGEPMPV